jgi:hypothetical protein
VRIDRVERARSLGPTTLAVPHLDVFEWTA